MSLVNWRNKQNRGEIERAGRESVPRSISQDFEAVFDRALQQFWAGWADHTPGAWAPVFDVVENEREILIRAEVPGVDPKDLDVQVAGRLLTVSGEKRDVTEEKSGTLFRSERRFGRFSRSIELPSAVEVDKVSARSEKGVLTISLPRSEKTKPKRIALR